LCNTSSGIAAKTLQNRIHSAGERGSREVDDLN
jgi:hypothetical protein